MKKLALVALLVLVAFGVSNATFAATEAAAAGAGQYDVLNMIGFDTPEWMLDQGSESTSLHPQCRNRPGCSYQLVGCCCVSSNPQWCSTYCF